MHVYARWCLTMESGHCRSRADSSPDDWLMWRRTLDGWGYSPLADIDSTNVKDLRLVWSRALHAPGRQQGTPLVYDRVLFMPSPSDVVPAIDAVTGDIIWGVSPVTPGRRVRVHDGRRMHDQSHGTSSHPEPISWAVSGRSEVSMRWHRPTCRRRVPLGHTNHHAEYDQSHRRSHGGGHRESLASSYHPTAR